MNFTLKVLKNVAEKVWDLLFETGEEFDILPTGLACRDSLRLEMGYCLYGNDIDQTNYTIRSWTRMDY